MREVIRADLAAHRAVIDGVDALEPVVAATGELLCRAFAAGGRVYAFGNGGSAAQAQHFAAELVGRYRRERRPLAAVALTTDSSVVTCIGNDYDFADVFARPVTALARRGDVVVAFTSSGRSPNVVAGLAAARATGATTVLLAAGDGGPAAAYADLALLAAAAPTARVQEAHLLLLHLLSEWVDAWAAGETDAAGHRLTAGATAAG